MNYPISIWIRFLILFNITFSQNFISIFSEIPLTTSELMSSQLAVNNSLSFFSLSNPSSNKVAKKNLQVDYQSYILDTYYGNITYMFPMEEYTISFGLAGLNSSDFEHRLLDGEQVGSYDNSALMIYASAAKSVYDSLRVAVTLKWNHVNLFDFSSQFLLTDIGASYQFYNGLKANLNFQDLAFNRVQFRNKSETIEPHSAMSFSYKLQHSPIQLFAGFRKPFHDNTFIGGFSYQYASRFSFVVSYDNKRSSALKKNEERNLLNGFSFGGILFYNDFQIAIGLRELGVLGSQFAFSFAKTFN